MIFPEDVTIEPVSVTYWRPVGSSTAYVDERLARHSAATHVRCMDCNAAIDKRYCRCDACAESRRAAIWLKKRGKPWDGKTDVYSETYNFYAQDLSEIIEWFEDHEMIPPDLTELRLVHLQPVEFNSIDLDDLMPDVDSDYFPQLPADIMLAIADINKRIAAADTKLQEPSNVRVEPTEAVLLEWAETCRSNDD